MICKLMGVCDVIAAFSLLVLGHNIFFGILAFILIGKGVMSIV